MLNVIAGEDKMHGVHCLLRMISLHCIHQSTIKVSTVLNLKKNV